MSADGAAGGRFNLIAGQYVLASAEVYVACR